VGGGVRWRDYDNELRAGGQSGGMGFGMARLGCGDGDEGNDWQLYPTLRRDFRPIM